MGRERGRTSRGAGLGRSARDAARRRGPSEDARAARRPLLLGALLALVAVLATIVLLNADPASHPEAEAPTVLRVARDAAPDLASPRVGDRSGTSRPTPAPRDLEGDLADDLDDHVVRGEPEPLLGAPPNVWLRSIDTRRDVIRARFEYRIDGDDAWRQTDGRFAWPPGARDVLHVAAEKPGWGRVERSLRRSESAGAPVTLMLGRKVRHWGRIVDAKGRPADEKPLVVSRTPEGSGVDRESVRSGEGGRFPLPFDPATRPLVWSGRVVAAGLPIDTLAYVPTEVVRSDPLEVRETPHTILPVSLDSLPSGVRWATALGTPGPVHGLVELDGGGRGFLALPGQGPLLVTLQVGPLSSEPFVVERSPRTVLGARAVSLSDRRRLGGVIVDARGDPVDEAWVAVLGDVDELRGWPQVWDVAGARPAPPSDVVVTRADGAFCCLPYRLGTLVAFRPGMRPALVSTAGLGAELETLVLTLADGESLALEMSAASPSSGVDVGDGELVAELARVGGPELDPAKVLRAPVDAGGRVAFDGLGRGPHALRVLRGEEVLADEIVDPSRAARVGLSLRRMPLVRFSLPEDAPRPRAVRLVPRDGTRALLVPPGDDGRTFEVRVPWTGVAEIESLAAQDAFVAGVPARWIPLGVITVGERDVVRVLPLPARSLSVRVDAFAVRAPFLVVVCDPLRPGAPVVASAQVAGDEAVVLGGLPEGFLRVDVLEAPSGLRSGGAFVGQGTTSLPERGVREIVVREHDGARASLGVRVTGAARSARAGIPVRARLSRTVLGEGVTDADGYAELDVPADVRGVVEALGAEASGTGAADATSLVARDERTDAQTSPEPLGVSATPYQSPGRREVLLRLAGGIDAPADR